MSPRCSPRLRQNSYTWQRWKNEVKNPNLRTCISEKKSTHLSETLVLKLYIIRNGLPIASIIHKGSNCIGIWVGRCEKHHHLHLLNPSCRQTWQRLASSAQDALHLPHLLYLHLLNPSCRQTWQRLASSAQDALHLPHLLQLWVRVGMLLVSWQRFWRLLVFWQRSLLNVEMVVSKTGSGGTSGDSSISDSASTDDSSAVAMSPLVFFRSNLGSTCTGFSSTIVFSGTFSGSTGFSGSLCDIDPEGSTSPEGIGLLWLMFSCWRWLPKLANKLARGACSSTRIGLQTLIMIRGIVVERLLPIFLHPT